MIEDVLQAIETRARVRADLTEPLTGGYHVGLAPKGTAMPYLSIVPLESTPEYDTESTTIEPVRLQFSFYAPKLSDLRTVVKRWRDAFRFQDIPAPNGVILLATVTADNATFEPASDDEPLSAWQRVLDFEFVFQEQP